VPDPKVSDKLVRAVAGWEGFTPVSKWDVNRWSWGYGTQAPGPNARISEADAREQLKRGLNAQVENIPRAGRMKQQEIDALASLAYNLGPRVLIDTSYSTLARRLRSRDGETFERRRDVYADEFEKWIMPGSIYEAGLLKRRKAEKRIARNGDYP
jgi:GH24 family phage-related lysozyme (muramidase)